MRMICNLAPHATLILAMLVATQSVAALIR